MNILFGILIVTNIVTLVLLLKKYKERKRMLYGKTSSRLIKEYVKEHWDRLSDAEMAERTGASINVVNHTRRGLGLRRDDTNRRKIQMDAIKKMHSSKPHD